MTSKIMQDEIILRKGIVHILDGELGYPVYSEEELTLSPDIAEFFQAHIYKLLSGDDLKKCYFDVQDLEHGESGNREASVTKEDFSGEKDDFLTEDPSDFQFYNLVREFSEEEFVAYSKKMTAPLYQIMNRNISIPSGDLAILTFQMQGERYLSLLKLNYKESFVHATSAQEKGNVNEIICYKSTLPGNTKLSEAIFIKLSDFSVQIVEKKVEINGEKKNYLSEIYLKCKAGMSQKSRFSIVTKAVEQINKKHFSEEPEKQMESKKILKQEIEETGSLNVERVSEKLYQDVPEIREEFETKMEKYHMEKAEVTPQSEKTVRKFEKQYLKTDTGIEINIPMEQYEDVNQVEFITNADGTISVLIKNINKISTR